MSEEKPKQLCCEYVKGRHWGEGVYVSTVPDPHSPCEVHYPSFAKVFDFPERPEFKDGLKFTIDVIEVDINPKETKVPEKPAFQEGDIVEAIAPVCGFSNLVGKTGKVVVPKSSTGAVGVEFSEAFEHSHSCAGKSHPDRGRYGKPEVFKLLYRDAKGDC